MNIDEFKKGRIEVPFPLRSDAYTISGDCLASSQAKQASTYQLVNRRSPDKVESLKDICKTGVMQLYGVTDYIRNQLTHRVTHDEVNKATEFMSTAHSFGGPLKFNPELWHDVVSDYGGYLPIKIEALPEGSPFLANEIPLQVTGLNGFGEMAAFIEPLILGMVSVATARLTITRHWLERIREYVIADGDMQNPDMSIVDATARFMIHDFGMRASSCAEESEMLGRAHLLVFNGTDTFSAAYQARVLGAKAPVGTSILALAHRIVQGYPTEREAYENLAKQDKIGSYVADCYSFQTAIRNHIAELVTQYPENTFVIRSDSGEWLPNLNAIETVRDERGSRVRYLNGDSIKPTTVDETFKYLKHLGHPGNGMTKWGIFGCGGWLRNTPNRDLFSSAFKLSSTSEYSVMKFSDTAAKESTPGPNVLTRGDGPTVHLKGEDVVSAYKTYYDCGEFGEQCVESFDVTSDRVINDFYMEPRDIFSDKVKELKRELRGKYLA